jgi:hypothetical protein
MKGNVRGMELLLLMEYFCVPRVYSTTCTTVEADSS